MLIKARILEHYNNYSFKIPLSGGEKLYVKNQQKINLKDPLFSKSENRIMDSYFLVDELGCKTSDCFKYITCIDGSYVDEGEIIAQKTSSNGLTIKQIKVKESGIVDLARINKGLVDILAEEETVTVESNFSGIVNDVLPGSYISINSPASALDLSTSTLFEEKLFGSLIFLNKENEVIHKLPDIALKEKIVWAGAYLSLDLAMKIFKKGAKAILTYSMEYDDFKGLGLPIGVIEGFGKIYCDQKLLTEFYKLDNNFAVLDGEEKQLFILESKQAGTTEKNFFVEGLLGSYVISRHSAHYGCIGQIIQINDLNYVTIDFGVNGKSVVDLGSLDFISM